MTDMPDRDGDSPAAKIAYAQFVADTIRDRWPEKAAEIDRALADARGDGITVTAGIRYRLEKFDGEITPGKQPYEVIEGEDKL